MARVPTTNTEHTKTKQKANEIDIVAKKRAKSQKKPSCLLPVLHKFFITFHSGNPARAMM